MKETVINEVFINRKAEVVYDACTDVEKWPDIFPPTKSVKVLEKEEDYIVFQISASTYDNKVETWVSRRDLDNKNLIIKFNQNKTVEELKSMEGEWTIKKEGSGSRIILSHTYEVSDERYTELVKRVMNKNSESELNALKKYLEE